MSKESPPLIRRAFTDPVGHCVGSAGNRVMISVDESEGTSGAWTRAFCICGIHQRIVENLVKRTHQKSGGIPKVGVDLEDRIGVERIVKAEQVRSVIPLDCILATHIVSVADTVD